MYDTKSHTNEELSLQWLLKDIAMLAPTLKINAVDTLLLSTKHKDKAKGDAALVQDIDLSILGASPAQFEAYDHAIRQEYHWVDSQTYQTERAKVLRKLGTIPIFATAHFRERLEAQAVINIAQAIQKLEKKL
jgi:predicted metal-dependent HD superfamily phosphohydrolase